MKEEIRKFFKGDIEDSKEILTQYSHDASLLEVRPELVLFPRDTEDIKSLVKWVGENKEKYPKLSITARCAGTDMSGGAIGESIILDFTRYMNHLVKFMDDVSQKSSEKVPQQAYSKNSSSFTLPDKSGGTYADSNFLNVPASITVQPGMFYRDFEKITLEKDLILPCFTASKDLNAMGGMYGNNSAGERTLKYGQTEDYILSAKIVFADGNEYVVKSLNQEELTKKIAQGDPEGKQASYGAGFEGEIYRKIYKLIKDNKEEIAQAKPRVNKNSAGYYIWNVVGSKEPKIPSGVEGSNTKFFDLNKLLVGSQGTLGIVTEITFKLVPQIKHSKLVVVFMNDIKQLGHLVEEILTFQPETLEAYDDKTMKLAVRFFPSFLKNKGLIKMIKFMWSFFPEFKMMLTGGFPKLILLVEFSGDNEKIVNDKCLKLKESIKEFKLRVHITKSETEAEKYWDIRRESFALLRNHIKGKRTAPFIDDIIVRPEFLPKFLPELNEILSNYNLTYTLAGHAGDGNFHVIPLMDFTRLDIAQIIDELSDKVYDLVLQYKGSITAEHNDGIIRTPYLEKMYGKKIITIFKEIKNIFDSKNIFNPGKKVALENGAGTKEYIMSHVAIEHDISHGS